MERETIDTLYAKARLAIASGEKALGEHAREAAEYLAEARNLGATQRDSAKAIGKSAGWVNALLRWRDGGYLTVFPFPRAARPLFGPRGRVQAAERKKQAEQKKSSRPPTTAEEAQAQAAKANAERAREEAEKAKAEASKARAEAKKARSENSKARAQARERLHDAFFGIFGGHQEKNENPQRPTRPTNQGAWIARL